LLRSCSPSRCRTLVALPTALSCLVFPLLVTLRMRLTSPALLPRTFLQLYASGVEHPVYWALYSLYYRYTRVAWNGHLCEGRRCTC
jgi:hypothetical protein